MREHHPTPVTAPLHFPAGAGAGGTQPCLEQPQARMPRGRRTAQPIEQPLDFSVQVRQAPGVLPLQLRVSLHVVEETPVATGIFGEPSFLEGSDPQGSKNRKAA